MLVLAGLAVSSAGCDGRFEGAGELRAQKVALEREVAGLKDMVSLLERGEAIVPPGDIAVVIEDQLIKDLIGAQLPFETDVDRYRIRLERADVSFRDSQTVSLSGSLYLRDNPGLSADVAVAGALEKIVIHETTSTLTTRVAVDHVAIQRLAGLEGVLGTAALDELSQSARRRVDDQFPPISIPVAIQQTIELPRVVAGPLRLDAASLPLRASVSRIVAGRGRLWIAIHLDPGDFVRKDER
ncbi:MAG: hypothetical protein Q7V01_14385 [Vicinamibacterales bacterium]|nr:hypothetical protein [Vicinamibacterales bacterium]